MSKESAIQWTDATWNIARGCQKVDEDCKFCYMYRDSFDGTRYNPREVNRTKTVFNMPLKLKEPSKIFTCSLTDFFLPEIDSYRDEAWDIIRKCPQHTFQILTKRPERIGDHLPEFWNEIENRVWLGTSVGSDNGVHRIEHLIRQSKGLFCKKFISFEPLHGEISTFDISTLIEIDWIIIGGESGNDTGLYRYRPCEIEWMEALVNDFNITTAIFIKQLGTHIAKKLKLTDRHGGNMDEWPESLNHLKIRQFPKL